MYFDNVRTGLNQKYKLFIDTFYIKAPKWVGLIENLSPIDFSRSNVDLLSEADYL